MRNNPQMKIYRSSVRYIGCVFRCDGFMLFHLSLDDADSVFPVKMACFTSNKALSEFFADASNANANAQFANLSRAPFGMGGMLLAFIPPNPAWNVC